MKHHSRRVIWLGLVALIGCGLLHSVSAQNTEKALPRPTPTPKIEVKKQTTDTTAIQALLTGSVSGKIYVYEREGPVMVIVPCASKTADLELLDSSGKTLAQRPVVPGKSAKRTVCHYEFRNIPAGTYTICTGGGSPCKELKRTLTITARKSSTLDLRVEILK